MARWLGIAYGVAMAGWYALLEPIYLRIVRVGIRSVDSALAETAGEGMAKPEAESGRKQRNHIPGTQN